MPRRRAVVVVTGTARPSGTSPPSDNNSCVLKSTRKLAQFYLLTKGKIPLIGVGGIEDGATALAKIEAGASLLQVYSALVYRGPKMLKDIFHVLNENIQTRGSLDVLRGSRAESLASPE